ncbi:hypothetical protein LOD99_13046 [Oopsacas minuta]|uniref:Uncharacterized protein n=1 Tax=Oopsacas minuta TaxID=111878 RepID=A0AAV7JAP4_9METZ|nr:hypothetical protein LOD99_13046 [Oopsacas minuta]
MLQPLIPYICGTIFHIIIVVTNFVSLIFSLGWVGFILVKISKIRLILRRLELLTQEPETAKILDELQTKKNKNYFFLSTTLLEASHVSLRLMTFAISTYFDFEPSAKCDWVEDYKAYDFITSKQPYQFIWISLSHCLVLSLMTTLIMTILSIRESYSYFPRCFKWVWRWAYIGMLQFIICWALLISPYTGLAGSSLYIVCMAIDFVALIAAGRKLYAILVMRLLDLQFEPLEWSRMYRGMTIFRRVSSVFIVTLFFYLIGVLCAHLGIWVALSPCYFSKFFSIHFRFTKQKVQYILDVASIIWLIDYIAVIQFDLVLIVVNIAYIVYSRLNYRDVNQETRSVIARYREHVISTRRSF